MGQYADWILFLLLLGGLSLGLYHLMRYLGPPLPGKDPGEEEERGGDGDHQ
jgi:hypothetical protein